MTTQRGGKPNQDGKARGTFGDRPTPRTPRPTAQRRQRTFIERYRGPLIGGVVLVLIVALAVIFVIKFGPSNQGKEQAAGAQPVDPAVLTAVTQIPASTFDTVGLGSANGAPAPIPAPALQDNGKPEFLYIGAEYCPFCAAERWAMIAALSRFGSFSNLHTTRSSASDVYPSTPTFSFYQSSYTSQYLAFDTVETYTNQPNGNGGYTTLQTPSSDQQQLLSTWDKPPYTASAGGIPFMDFGGKYVLSGATYDPGVLANMDWSQVAQALATPSSPQAQGIIGSANLLTATFCQMTNQQPANVCQSPGVQKAAAKLPKS